MTFEGEDLSRLEALLPPDKAFGSDQDSFDDDSYDAPNFPTPREFQTQTLEKLRAGVRAGHKRQVVMAATGSGKTMIGMKIIHETLAKGNTAMFVCDRTTLINQTSSVADAYGLSNHGIIQADHWRKRRSRFQIASLQTLARRGWPKVDVLIIDECFSGDTPISTPRGERPIDTISSGDVIYNSCGEAQVLSVFSKRVFATVKVRLDDGSEFECTGDHPIFTELGWRPAGTLERGQSLFRKEDVSRLWRNDPSVHPSDWNSRGPSPNGGWFPREEMLRAVLREEIEEPDALAGDPKEAVEDAARHRTSPSDSGRQRTRSDGRPTARAFDPRTRMETGGSRQDAQASGSGVSPSLQGGPAQRAPENRAGTGRTYSQLANSKGEGREERPFAPQPRVASVTAKEHPGGIDVFNLRVSTHPSYFANGVLVHNCHSMYKAWTEHIPTCGAVVIGLSATPFSKGMGKLFSNLVNAATMEELTKSGVLVPMRIFSCARINMEGAKTAGGEWTDLAAEERGLEIIGDVVEEWNKFAEGRKTIVFGSTIAHCEAMVRQFNEAGITAATFTAETTAEERATLLNEYRKPDSLLRVLVSVEALAKGFDVPDVGCICDCRPLRKSLSTAIQMWGRGLRSAPDKKDCLLLDFSGNIVRFADDFSEIFFNGLSQLDSGEVLDKKIRREDEEPKGRKCPQCGYQPCGKRCVACGYERVRQNLTEHQEGEMFEFKVGKATVGDKLDVWQQAVTLCREQGKPETAAGRAAWLYKSVVGVFPRNLPPFDLTPDVHVSAAMRNKLRSNRIAYRAATK